MIQPRYLRVLALGALLWCGLYFAFTLTIDPYGVSPVRVAWERVNKIKPKRLDIDRLIKPYEVWRYQPRTVYLGTSRIHQAIDPAVLDGTAYAPGYNASIPASSLGLNISHLRQYVALDRRLRTVVIELFFYNFVGQGQERAPKTFAEYARNTATLFVSADTLWAAVQTLFHNLLRGVPVYEVKAGGYFDYPPGHQPKGLFDGFPEGVWKLHAMRGGITKLHEPAFESFREFISVAHEHGLELVFVLTPNHAYDDYYLEAIGAWNEVQEWLTRLSAEATVYSFSQPNAWVYEPVRTTMRYWNDPYHFSLRMGRAMQLSMAGAKAEPDTPEDLMVRMTPDKVAAHIASRRTAIRRWAQENPEFVAKFYEEWRKWEAARADSDRKK